MCGVNILNLNSSMELRRERVEKDLSVSNTAFDQLVYLKIQQESTHCRTYMEVPY